MFERIYHDYLLHKQRLNSEERYEGREGWYHASGAGLCSRKLYYQSIEKLESPSKEFDDVNAESQKGQRRMRLGTIIHEDIQNALIYYNNINNNNIVLKEKKEILSKKKKSLEFVIEEEVQIRDLNVRGFYDILVLEEVDGQTHPLVKLYDIKTVDAWSWKNLYPKGTKNEIANDLFEKENYKLQLGTYGLAVREKYGHLDQMGFIYYNTNTQILRKSIVPLEYVEKARRYWYSINEEHSKGVPGFKPGTSPAKAWVCGYCDYFDHCKPPVGIGKEPNWKLKRKKKRGLKWEI